MLFRGAQFAAAGRTWLLARARKAAAPAEAVALLREHTPRCRSRSDITLADCYQAANDLRTPRVLPARLLSLPSGATALRAAALLTLKDAMGSSYPPPAAAQLLHRATA